jgi:enoyl-CoA hydratase
MYSPLNPAEDDAPMSFVLVDKPRPHVTLITLNRPDRMNAMAFDVMVPFREALEAVSADNDTRVVVLTGAGRGFCSGADLENSGRIPGIKGLTRTSIARRSMEILDDVILGLRRMHQPVIGAINGPAIGGGFCLATATDIRIASDTAYFRAAGINNGLTASELGISYLLPRAIGSSRAFEIMLSGRDVDATEAERIGLVSRVVPGEKLLDDAYELAERIVGFSRVGVEVTKRLLWSGMEAGSMHSHMDHEGHAQLYVRLTTENFEEAIRARKDKRQPEYKD